MNNHNSYKKLNTNISQKEYNQNIKKINFPFGFFIFFLVSIIKYLYYLSAILVLKIYYQLKIDEITHKGYLLFFILDTLLNGGSIYYIIYSLIKFYDLYSPLNQEWAYIYIWIICCFQLLFLFTSIILFFMKYIYIKLFLISKFKILFIILCIVIILSNFFSLNCLDNDKYSFQIENFELKKLSGYKEYFKRNYLNLYLNKEYDFNEYELCFEMKYNNFTELIKEETLYSIWKFEQKDKYFIGCRNVSFKENPSIDKNNPLSFFKCDINNKINILPNYCISAEIRKKKYNFIYKLNIFQILLLISFFIYEKICNYIFYKYHLYNISKEYYEDLQEKNENEDGGEGEEEEDGDEDDDEGEEEEDDEEEEEVEEKIKFRSYKYRKISKKKKKYYKKKYRFRKYNLSSNNIKNNNNNNINDEENKDENFVEENNEENKEEKEEENEEKKEKLINDENQSNNKDNNFLSKK